MADQFKVTKFIRIVLLNSRKPLSYPEIQNELKNFKVEASEPDILKALNNMSNNDRELVQLPLNEVQVTETSRSSYYKAGRLLTSKTDAKVLILNEIVEVDEKHISAVEDLFYNNEVRVDLQSLLNEMNDEGLIRFKTTDHHFIAITFEGREYLNFFNS